MWGLSIIGDDVTKIASSRNSKRPYITRKSKYTGDCTCLYAPTRLSLFFVNMPFVFWMALCAMYPLFNFTFFFLFLLSMLVSKS